MGWSGLYDQVHGDGHSLRSSNNVHRIIGRALKPAGRKKFKELLRTLVTDDVGSAASATHKRVEVTNVPDELGGVRNIETVTVISRNVAASDETEILAAIDYDNTPTFPTDASGNGGGGKLGY